MWKEHPGLRPCIDALTAEIAQAIMVRLKEAGSFTLAVSGGRSPIPLFERLATLELDWPRVHIQLVDERFVPPDHPDSNEGLVRRHLLVDNAAAADFHGLYQADASIEQAVAYANANLRPVDLAILGMGEDGHTASIFPGARQLDEALAADAAYYLHVTPPSATHERITMSMAALQSCPQLLLYISGQKKREVFAQAQKKINKQLPVSFLVAEAGVPIDVHWHP